MVPGVINMQPVPSPTVGIECWPLPLSLDYGARLISIAAVPGDAGPLRRPHRTKKCALPLFLWELRLLMHRQLTNNVCVSVQPETNCSGFEKL